MAMLMSRTEIVRDLAVARSCQPKLRCVAVDVEEGLPFFAILLRCQWRYGSPSRDALALAGCVQSRSRWIGEIPDASEDRGLREIG